MRLRQIYAGGSAPFPKNETSGIFLPLFIVTITSNTTALLLSKYLHIFHILNPFSFLKLLFRKDNTSSSLSELLV